MSTTTVSTFREGWLYKLSWLNIHKTWRRRYFVLKDNELRYYKQPNDVKPAGVIELKHYRKVSKHPVKQSPYAFRIESRCRHHLNQLLYAENGMEGQVWMEMIQAHLDKHLPAQHQCGSSSSTYHNTSMTSIDQNLISSSSNHNHNDNDNNDSVLDKWLERLDLQDEKPNHSSEELAPYQQHDASSVTSSSSSFSSSRRPVSLSFALGYQSNDSLDTIGSSSVIASSSYDNYSPAQPPSNSIHSNNNINTTTSSLPLSPALSTYSSNDTQRPSSALLANAFSQNAQTRLRRRLTTTSDRMVSCRRQLQHRSPPLSPQSLDTSATTMRRRDNIEQSSSSTASAVDLFHIEHEDRPPRYARYSMDALMMPPRHPPPTTPLPPPPPTTTTTATVPPRRFSTHSSARY
ncbi:predicted protein [Lichtheimia corymbifera JMRC:FSU:9682]|uniref:PH domain-containing protein n=1 Tax=Lichtheimia corymbifera JMRC:FSU:9682 TaxID=1263082 RepID=A0A068RSX1_9FUNG|nr:predicted protein [Lichtheimia corymbifera JMRC:FSU:9682]